MTRKHDDVNLVELEDRINAARHTAALAALAVTGIFHGFDDKDALEGLTTLLLNHGDGLREIGRDVAKVRSAASPLKVVAA